MKLLKLHPSVDLPPPWLHLSQDFLQTLGRQIRQWGQRLLLRRLFPQATTLRVWYRWSGAVQPHIPKCRIRRLWGAWLQASSVSRPDTAMRIRRWWVEEDLTIIHGVASNALKCWAPQTIRWRVCSQRAPADWSKLQIGSKRRRTHAGAHKPVLPWSRSWSAAVGATWWKTKTLWRQVSKEAVLFTIFFQLRLSEAESWLRHASWLNHVWWQEGAGQRRRSFRLRWGPNGPVL